jgi:hypothetical protein
VKGVEQHGAKVIYAGKVAFSRPRKSRQIPDLEWEAFVVSQYATREAWETVAVSANYIDLKSEFTRVWSLGMKRKARLNLVVSLSMLMRRIRPFLSGDPATYPFESVEVPIHYCTEKSVSSLKTDQKTNLREQSNTS